jgi:release factor glutamine methyltransferase
LDGGQDGTDTQRRVAVDAARWLAPGGHLLIQTSEQQAALTAGLVADAHLRPQVVLAPELDAVVVIGTKDG